MDTKGACTIYNAVSKLVGAIEKQVKNDSKVKNIKEMASLQEFCSSEHPVVSITACQGIVFLVENECLPIVETILSLISSSQLSSAKNISGVTNAVVSLMLLNLKAELREQNKYQCPYKMKTYPIHPLITILKHRPHIWRDVLNHVDSICNNSDQRISDNSLELLTPVFLYILQEQNDLPEVCRHHTWSFLVNNFIENSLVLDLVISFLSWNRSRVLELNSYFTILCEAVLSSRYNDLMLITPLFVSVLVHRLLETAYTPQATLLLLKKLATVAVNTHSIVLIMLSHTITICPAVFLQYLLDFCLWLIQQGNCTLDAIWMCVSALLPWLVISPKQMQEPLETATKIISLAKVATANPSVLKPLFSNKLFPVAAGAVSTITTAVHLAKLSENLRDDSNQIVLWLEATDSEGFEQLHLYACSLLIGRPIKEVRLAALNFLTKCPLKFATHNLNVILYQLAREKESYVQLALLNALPSTAVDKENIPVVISTIKTLCQNQDKVLRFLSIQLSLKLWIVQERCYPILTEVLSQNVETLTQDEIVEFNIVVAAACKEICNLRPEKHFKEMVVQISDLLSRCGGYQDSISSSLSLDALAPLCKEAVIDTHSIWKHLAPRLTKDKRPAVLSSDLKMPDKKGKTCVVILNTDTINRTVSSTKSEKKSFCNLVSFTATTSSPARDSEETLMSVSKWLWQNVVSSPHVLVAQSSLAALSRFKLEQMSLKSLPECFRRGLKLPPEMAKTPVDAARKPEDVLPYIPGNCWVQMLQQIRIEVRDAAVKAVACWLSEELATYRGGTYNLARGEPIDYKHLRESSVCRGLCEFIRRTPSTASESDITTVTLCLTVASQSLPKPLPPLDWTFLNDFFKRDNSELTVSIIRLLAKQAQISPSGRKILESYMNSNLSPDKVEFLYSLLTDLCRGIPPNSLRSFMDQTLRPAFDKNDQKTLGMILGCIKTTLHNQKIHEANLVLLSQQVQALWSVFDAQHVLFEEYLACASELPISYIETMSSISLMWEVTSANLQKAIKFRAYMSLVPDAPTPLVWLNEIIEAATSSITEQVLVVEVVDSVLEKLHNHPTAWNWLQELMGQIYKTITDNQPGLDFLVSLFIIAVDWISGYAVLGLETVSDINLRYLRFPQAVAKLVKSHGDAKQMTEWLKFLQIQTDFNPTFVPVFQLAAKIISVLE